MKICPNCGQLLAEDIMTCPSCGGAVGEGRKSIDDYHITEILHEGYSSILCRAVKEGSEEPVMIRIFTPVSGVDEKIAERLEQELEELKKLPEDYFVRHHEIKRSADGLWYRVSEWIEAENWASLLASGRLKDYRLAFRLFSRIASILEGLHRIGHIIPHLILDDIMVFQGDGEELQVKIDYKLSRFLDPKMDRPGPMLKRLLSMHPDIINNRPLDDRSDIWSLGKIFVELLSGDPEVQDLRAGIDQLSLPHDIEVLLKVMLADDPDSRPPSMDEVAKTLSKVTEEEIEVAEERRREGPFPPAREIRGLKRRISLLIILAILAVIGLGIWFYLSMKQDARERSLTDYANKYAGSVAFVVAEYWLTDGEQAFRRVRTEGTAFLVDAQGYLLTNRHVACPWLEDRALHAYMTQLVSPDRSLQLKYRLYLWFEGQKAFKRIPGFADSADLNDIYFLNAAHSTTGKPGLRIAGVARPPEKAWQLLKSPLKDDFAVLKIDTVPEGLIPLPLDQRMEASKVPKLSPVIALGFPLGSRTQETTVNVSVTRGNVRRTFESMLQVDTSLYGGNSGGPIIDDRGKVIGIASAVAVDLAIGPVPMATLLSDIGLVLPITKAVRFLEELKAGQVKWNGVLDLSIETKVKRITRLARQNRWAEAAALADQELGSSLDPSLVLAAAMMHFCAENWPRAEALFRQALSMDVHQGMARLMLYTIDWLAGQPMSSPYREDLLALGWESPYEFLGYLVRILEAEVDEDTALRGGYSRDEKSWLCYVVALLRAKKGDLAGSETLLRQAAMEADTEDWIFYLALSRLQHVQRQRGATYESQKAKTEYEAETEAFFRALEKENDVKLERRKQLQTLLAGLNQAGLGISQKKAILEQIRQKDETDGTVLVRLAYFCALEESWDKALQYARAFLEIEGRENADRLRMGLMEAEILHNSGQQKEAKARLVEYRDRTKASWFRTLAACLLGEVDETSLAEKAGESPVYLITGHTALGFWAEGSGDRAKAVEHYKEALGSYRDDMVEFEFATERLRALKQSQP